MKKINFISNTNKVLRVFGFWLLTFSITSIAFAAVHSYARTPSTFNVSSPITFSFSVDSISDICGSSPQFPVPSYWWIEVSPLGANSSGNCADGGDFCSQAFTTSTLSINAHMSLPARSDYYLVGITCSDNANDINDPNGNFWGGVQLEGNQENNPIFDVQNVE